MDDRANGVLVLGIGNVLWADEGFGVRAVEALHAGWELPGSVTLLDGGTQGLNLLGPVCDAHSVLVFDAIDFGLPPGTLRVLRDREVPAWASTKMSLHQSSFQELLSIADLQGRFPTRLALVGVQPERLADFGGSLSDSVRLRLDDAVRVAIDELGRWSVRATPRSAPPADRLNAGAIDIDPYEAGRPPEEAACRIGDARFLNIRHRLEQS